MTQAASENLAPHDGVAPYDGIVGIDLGTTNSLVARVVNGKPEIVRDAKGERHPPGSRRIVGRGDQPQPDSQAAVLLGHQPRELAGDCRTKPRERRIRRWPRGRGDGTERDHAGGVGGPDHRQPPAVARSRTKRLLQ